ncbi:hypothetical protein OY671_011822, partial [Metschnikowia pulcherrima]
RRRQLRGRVHAAARDAGRSRRAPGGGPPLRRAQQPQRRRPPAAADGRRARPGNLCLRRSAGRCRVPAGQHAGRRSGARRGRGDPPDRREHERTAGGRARTRRVAAGPDRRPRGRARRDVVAPGGGGVVGPDGLSGAGLLLAGRFQPRAGQRVPGQPHA